MPREIPSASFPATQRDVSRLRQSATDAVNDFSSTVASHANKVSGQFRDLAHHMRQEGRSNIHRVRVKLADLAQGTRDFARERPFLCLGAALALGVMIGLSRRRPRRDDD